MEREPAVVGNHLGPFWGGRRCPDACAPCLWLRLRVHHLSLQLGPPGGAALCTPWTRAMETGWKSFPGNIFYLPLRQAPFAHPHPMSVVTQDPRAAVNCSLH